MFSHQGDMAVPELVLCENVVQQLDFSVVPLNYSSIKTCMHKIPISARKIISLLAAC